MTRFTNIARVDTSRSGWIDINELQQALKNENSAPFRLETCKIMLDMFDHQNCGQIRAAFLAVSTFWLFYYAIIFAMQLFFKNPQKCFDLRTGGVTGGMAGDTGVF